MDFNFKTNLLDFPAPVKGQEKQTEANKIQEAA